MTGYIFDAAGRKWQLPPLLDWDLSHGFGSPCDSFQVGFLYQPEMEAPLEAACRFAAEHGGETVFFGVVDELEVSLTAAGLTAALRGRGMQALMLDSEAESADYYGADAAFIVSRHVLPLGIEQPDLSAAGGKRASLSVSSGESHWSVFSRFAEFCLGLSPRFDPRGKLLLDGKSGGRVFSVDGKTPVEAMSLVQDRYGVVTKALVKNRVYGTTVEVDNPAVEGLGMQARRVINVPRRTGYDAMRHTGAYQIQKSMEDFRRVSLSLPEPFAAFPGDRVELQDSPLGLEGRYLVRASRSWGSAGGCGTVLEIKKE
ncbi:MAG: hypothetical protein ACI4PC_07285 [Oscillospiraceae bacterium]